MKHIPSAGGSKLWFVADGWLPSMARTDNTGFEGNEAIRILNCNDREAQANLAYIAMMAHAG